MRWSFFESPWTPSDISSSTMTFKLAAPSTATSNTLRRSGSTVTAPILAFASSFISSSSTCGRNDLIDETRRRRLADSYSRMPGALGLLPGAMIRTPNRNNKIKDNRRLIIPVSRFLPATRAKTAPRHLAPRHPAAASLPRLRGPGRRGEHGRGPQGQGRRRARDQGCRRGDTDRLRSPTPTFSPYGRGSETLALAACRPRAFNPNPNLLALPPTHGRQL